jgi:hypothetical protein
MMNYYHRIILIGIFCQLAYSQVQSQIQVELTLTNLTENRIVRLGVDPSASDAIDPHLGEEALPPWPPGIEVRFALPDNGFSGVQSYSDYRQGVIPFTGQVEHRLKFQRGQGDSLMVIFNLPPEITINIQDLFGGIIVNTQFVGNGSYIIPNPDALGQLRLLVNYNNAPSEVELESTIIPESIELEQNYPNPFNPSTKINFSIDQQTIVRIQILDLLGKEVALLVHEQLQPGKYSTEFDASGWPSGVYFYQLSANGVIISKKMILQK